MTMFMRLAHKDYRSEIVEIQNMQEYQIKVRHKKGYFLFKTKHLFSILYDMNIRSMEIGDWITPADDPFGRDIILSGLPFAPPCT